MHFVFGPCSTIVEKGGERGNFGMLEVLRESLRALSDVKHGMTLC